MPSLASSPSPSRSPSLPRAQPAAARWHPRRARPRTTAATTASRRRAWPRASPAACRCRAPSPSPPTCRRADRRTTARAPPASAPAPPRDAPSPSPPARTRRRCAARTSAWRRARPSPLLGLLAGQHHQAFMRDLDALDRDLVLARVEIRALPLAHPARREEPLGLGAVRTELRDRAADAIGRHAPLLLDVLRLAVVHEAEAQLPEIRVRAAQPLLQDDVG